MRRRQLGPALFCKYRNRLAYNNFYDKILYVFVDISDKRLPQTHHPVSSDPTEPLVMRSGLILRFRYTIKLVTNDMILNDQSGITYPRTLAILKELATIRKN